VGEKRDQQRVVPFPKRTGIGNGRGGGCPAKFAESCGWEKKSFNRKMGIAKGGRGRNAPFCYEIYLRLPRRGSIMIKEKEDLSLGKRKTLRKKNGRRSWDPRVESSQSRDDRLFQKVTQVRYIDRERNVRGTRGGVNPLSQSGCQNIKRSRIKKKKV